MQSELFLDLMKVTHGSFNILVTLLFLLQAGLGLAVRRGRMRGEPKFKAVRWHRRLGPYLVAMGLLGYCFGLTLVSIDKGHVLEYPLHFAVGTTIVIFLLAQYVVSRKLRGVAPPWRTAHLAIGAGIVCLYLAQVTIGFAVLL